jgi:hypothetical protein
MSLIIVAASCGLSFSKGGSQVTVMVRVLDYRTGHPARGRRVAISTAPTIRNDHDWLISKTGKDGVALFKIKEPMPRLLRIDPEAGSFANWSCTQSDARFDLSGTLELATSQVLGQGVIGNFTNSPLCRHHVSLIPAAKPGVIRGLHSASKSVAEIPTIHA